MCPSAVILPTAPPSKTNTNPIKTPDAAYLLGIRICLRLSDLALLALFVPPGRKTPFANIDYTPLRPLPDRQDRPPKESSSSAKGVSPVAETVEKEDGQRELQPGRRARRSAQTVRSLPLRCRQIHQRWPRAKNRRHDGRWLVYCRWKYVLAGAPGDPKMQDGAGRHL